MTAKPTALIVSSILEPQPFLACDPAKPGPRLSFSDETHALVKSFASRGWQLRVGSVNARSPRGFVHSLPLPPLGEPGAPDRIKHGLTELLNELQVGTDLVFLAHLPVAATPAVEKCLLQPSFDGRLVLIPGHTQVDQVSVMLSTWRLRGVHLDGEQVMQAARSGDSRVDGVLVALGSLARLAKGRTTITARLDGQLAVCTGGHLYLHTSPRINALSNATLITSLWLGLLQGRPVPELLREVAGDPVEAAPARDAVFRAFVRRAVALLPDRMKPSSLWTLPRPMIARGLAALGACSALLMLGLLLWRA
jgi:hypothetical protein